MQTNIIITANHNTKLLGLNRATWGWYPFQAGDAISLAQGFDLSLVIITRIIITPSQIILEF